MPKLTFPGLYHEANRASDRQQRFFLTVVLAEFASLFIASVLTINVIPEAWYIIVYGLVLAAAGALLAIRSVMKPEQGWYQARALAESVKTMAWKYAMQAKPFYNEEISIDHAMFRNALIDLLRTNQNLGHKFDSEDAMSDQITLEMDLIRSLSVNDRLKIYLDQRVDDQRRWYAVKAGANRRWSKISVVILSALYASAFVSLLARIAKPDWIFSHPDPLIILASAVIGWMQIKKFNELSTSYQLTAIEIGIIKSRIPEINDKEDMSNFVDDAEEAFSREHTQWLARRSYN